MWFFDFVIYLTILVNSCHGLQVPETMSSDEVIKTFGIRREMISSFEFVSLNTPNNRRKRDTSWTLEIVRNNDSKIVLNLQERQGLLADENTRIYEAVGDDSGNVKYTRDEQVMKEMGSFTAYHDHSNKAAVILFHKTETLEGLIGNEFILRSVPKDSFSKLYEANPWVEHQYPSYIGLYEDYVLIEKKRFPNILREPKDAIANQESAENQEKFYLQMLIALDFPAVRNVPRIEVIQSVLTFWNSVDMLYSNVTKPKIFINVAGIVIPQNEEATPYLNRAKKNPKQILLPEALDGFRSHFYEAEKDFPFDSYDYAYLMTSYALCRDSKDGYCGIKGRSQLTADCTSRIDEYNRRIAGGGIIYHEDFYASYSTAAHELGHLLSMGHDNRTGGCNGIGSGVHYWWAHKLEWSQCSLDSFEKFFKEKDVGCLGDPRLPQTKSYESDTLNYIVYPGDLCSPRRKLPITPEVCEDTLCFKDHSINKRTADTNTSPTKFVTVCEVDQETNEPTKVCKGRFCLPYDAPAPIWPEDVCRRYGSEITERTPISEALCNNTVPCLKSDGYHSYSPSVDGIVCGIDAESHITKICIAHKCKPYQP